jgi:MinD-like ATPase involved in chromosome partitioning or flagellar assembly
MSHESTTTPVVMAVEDDGRVFLDGEPVAAADAAEAYTVALARLTEKAQYDGAPVLVRAIDSGRGEESWFSINQTGETAPAQAPAGAELVDQTPAPLIQAPPARTVPPMPPLPPTPAPSYQVEDTQPRPHVQAHQMPVQQPVAQQQAYAPGEPQPVTRRERRVTARDFIESEPAPEVAPAELGFRGRVNTMFGMRLAPSPEEATERQNRKAVQRGIDGHKTVGVLAEKGGVGKTTTSYLLGAVLGRVRGGTVLVHDGNPYSGTLNDRSYDANHDLTAADLLEDIDRFTETTASGDLINFVRAQGENKFDVLASQNKASDSRVVNGEGFRKLHNVLKRFYRLIVVDTGNNVEDDTWKAVTETADQLVIVTILRKDSARKLAALADKLVSMGHGDKLDNAVTIISHASSRHDPDLERRTVEHMKQITRAVHVVPFDPMLDKGDVIDYAALTRESKKAWLQVTASVVDGLK